MNFYKHHLGDYDGATAHLSWDEDMAYTRLLRVYYRREKPITDAVEAYRLIRAISKAHRGAVDSVLAEFFEQRDDGWHNKRADEEIEAYQAQAAHNRVVGNLGGRPKKTTVVSANNQGGSETKPIDNPNQEPLTKNQEPLTNKNKGTPTGVALLIELGVAEQHAKDWLAVRKAKRAPLTDTVIQNLHAQASKAGISVAEAVAICAEKSWQGFSADWLTQDAKKPNGAPAWWTSDAGIEAKAREVGITPQRGETWQQLKGRVQQSLGGSA